jgi:hypothetical protein
MPVPKRLLAFAGSLVLIAASVRAAELESAMKDVERLRGVTFLHDVSRRTVERKDLRNVLRREMAKSLPYSTEEYLAVLGAMRLVDNAQPQLIEKLLDLYESQVLAFYDPVSHTYYAITEMPPSLAALGNVEALSQSVVVHELTHALQDQRFGASTRDFDLRRDADGQLAYHALLEGEASLVMLAWLMDRAGQPLSEVIKNDALLNMAASATAAEAMIDPSTPRYFVESLKFPYIDGLRLIVAGYRRGGWKDIDRMHANPPRTTREIINIDEYLARLDKDEQYRAFKVSRSVTPPPNVRSVEHLGQFHWRFLLGENARGWVDDRVTIGCDDIVRAETWWDSVERAIAFRDAYVALLRKEGNEPRVKTDGSFVEITYLAP